MNPYGAGLFIDTERGWKSISHNGATAGYRSNLQHYPELGLSIAWLSNTSEFDRAPNLADEVNKLLVKDKSATKAAAPTPVKVPVEKLNSYAGWYKDSRSANGVKMFVRDGKLNNSRGWTLVPVAENVFMLGQNRIEVQTGKPKQLLFISPVDTVHYYATDSAQLDPKTMNEYAGQYWSEEADAKFDILVKDGKLIAHRDPATDYVLTPAYKDGFIFPGTNVYFERDKNNRIISMKIFVGRARNVEFTKQMR